MTYDPSSYSSDREHQKEEILVAGRELKHLRGCRDLRQFRRIADSVTRAVTHAFFAPNRPPNRGHSTKFHLPLVSYFASSFGSLATTLPFSQT
jgi:hypothetical protein